MIDYLDSLRVSAMFQGHRRFFGQSPGTFGSKRPAEDERRMQSPITGKPAPATVDEAQGSTPAAKAGDKERRKKR